MKNLLVVTSLLFSLIAFSQTKVDFDYEALSNPNSENELSFYFNKEIPKKLLKKVIFAPKKHNVILSFSINKEKKPYNVKINNFRNPALKKAIIDAFKSYPLEKLQLANLNSKNRYHLQILSKNKNKAFINCSSKIIVEVPPTTTNCNNLAYYEDIKSCFNLQVMQHFYNNANFDLLENNKNSNQSYFKEEKDIILNLFNEVELLFNFSISEDGKLKNEKSDVPTIFKNEVEKLFNSFPQTLIVSTFNDTFYKSVHRFTIPFKKGEKPVYEDIKAANINFTKPNIKNDLSIYFAEKLSTDFIEKANLNTINNSVAIIFELDKKNIPFNLLTNARSIALNDEIISIFKKYPVDKLTFANKGKFNRYQIQILSFTDNKTIVNTASIIGYMKFPVFESCENSKNSTENKQCFSKSIQKHFTEKFDPDLPNRLGLSPGKLRILVSFKIDKNAQIAQIRTKLSPPSPEIEFEIKKILSLLPKMQSPQIQNDKVLDVKFTFPFTLVVQ
jgi:hypothetical protein